MSAHTQGKWDIEFGAAWADVFDQEGRAIAFVLSGRSISETKANACLIAAAPMLLEALKKLVKANEQWNASVEAVIGRVPNWSDEHLDEARAAIAAATGGQS